MQNDGEPREADVVIVGGRPAGASLAARLGQRGLKVVIVDKAEHPSRPAVPSCPILYPPAMRLLDELGLDEADWADPSAKIERFGFQFDTFFSTTLPVPEMFGRAYAMGIDRPAFDHLLWKSLARHPSVERRAGFAVGDLLRGADGRVVGVEGIDAAGHRHAIRARLTVGADGRFSVVARRAFAPVVEDCSQKVSTVYFADWEGLKPFAPGMPGHASVFATGRGTSVLFFPAPGGRTMVATHQRADRVQADGDVEGFYLRVLDSFAGVRRRLEGARRVSDVVGVKRIANRYLQHGGPGWALVGDALHHKDPVDGQGIYDALVTAKLLAETVGPVLGATGGPGGPSGPGGPGALDAAVDAYGRAALAETRPMFLATMKRLERELYEEPPAPVIKTLIRWLMTDPEYQRRFLLFLGRSIPPGEWLPASVVRGAVLRGVARDLRALVGGRGN